MGDTSFHMKTEKRCVALKTPQNTGERWANYFFVVKINWYAYLLEQFVLPYTHTRMELQP